MLADAVADRWALPAWRRARRARITEGIVAGEPVTVLKPTTYMNRSGQALAPLWATPGFDPAADLLVLVDDMALPLGTFRLRARGSAGGHNGLKSIQGAVGGIEYARLRIGIGPVPDEVDDRAAWVLEAFSPDELATLADLEPAMVDAVDAWRAHGIEHAMNRFNALGTQPTGE